MARKLYKYKGPRCGKMIKCKLSKDLVPCDGDSGHKGRHTPSLKGLYTRVGVLIEDRGLSTKASQSTWHLQGREKPDRAYNLLSGRSTGILQQRGAGNGCTDKKGLYKPEYYTWKAHFAWVTNPKNKGYKNYKGMPFYPDWEPKKFNVKMQGYLNFERWLKSTDGIGMRPSKKHSLDIIEHHKGFWPGNLRWTCKFTQSRNKRHRTMFMLTLEQHRAALKLLGYSVIKANNRRLKSL